MKKKESQEPFSVWSEDELLDGKRARCLTIILSTPGCAWWRTKGGCSMCGYNFKASSAEISQENIKNQFDRAWKTYDSHSIIKIYTSGSFLDEFEISYGVRKHILETVVKSGAKLLFESRPEYVKKDIVADCIDICPDIEIALGLESANDKILMHSIYKGFSFSDYLHASKEIRDAGASVRTYLLLKPPYITEKEAIEDVESSIERVKEISRVISINPVNVQRGTKLERIWKSWAYRPPWLWSVLKILRDSKPGNAMLIASTNAAGSERGAHNCDKCNGDIVQAIEKFNLSQDKQKIDNIDCDCKIRWEEQLEAEEFSISTSDLERFFSR